MIRICTVATTVWLKLLRRKDIYVLLILLGSILSVLVSLDVFGLSGAIRYIKETGLMMAWLFGWILAIISSTSELPDEEKNGTIYPLLAKPLTRLELITGKWLGCWTIACTATLMFYSLVFTVVIIKGGSLHFPVLLQGYLLHCSALAVMCALGLAFSTRMNHDAAATVSFVLTACMFIIIPRVPEFMLMETGFNSGMLMFLYNALPHFELFDMRRRLVHDFPCISPRVFSIIIIYALLWTSLFLGAAWSAYKNKSFERSRNQ